MTFGTATSDYQISCLSWLHTKLFMTGKSKMAAHSCHAPNILLLSSRALSLQRNFNCVTRNNHCSSALPQWPNILLLHHYYIEQEVVLQKVMGSLPTLQQYSSSGNSMNYIKFSKYFQSKNSSLTLCVNQFISSKNLIKIII